MKRAVNIIGFVATLLVVTGVVFKIQHWSGAAPIIVLGDFTLGLLYLPALIMYKRKTTVDKNQRILITNGLIALALLVIGLLFKIQLWPGAEGILIGATSTFCFSFMTKYISIKMKAASNKHEKYAHLSLGIAIIVFTIAVLFRLTHWQLVVSQVLLVVGILLLFTTYFPLIIIAFKGNSEERSNILNKSYLTMVVVASFMAVLLNSGSGAVVNAFGVINENIIRLTNSFSEKSNATYILPNASTNEKLKKAKQLSDDLYNYISKMQSNLIARTDKIPSEEADSILVSEISSKDNYDIPTFVLGLKDPNSPATTVFTANELKNKIIIYKKDMLSLLEPLSKEDANSLESKLGLSTAEYMADDQESPWEVYPFYHEPLVAVITTLNHIKSNVRYTESEIVSQLYNQTNIKQK